MPRHTYSPDQKAAALQSLDKNFGDIAATSYQIGIPQRTLYTWRMEDWDQQRQRRQTQPPPSPINLPKFESTIEAFEHLRTRMFTILDRIPLDLSHLPPYLQRDREAARLTLVDIIIKLTSILGVPEPEYDEIEYVHEYTT